MAGELAGRDDVRVVVQVSAGAYGGGVPGAVWDDPGTLWDDSGTVWAGTERAWITLTCDVKEVQTRRGRSDALGRFAAGTASVVLENIDDPFTLGEGVEVGRYLRVRVSVAGGQTLDVFTGQIVSVRQDDDPLGGSRVSLTLAGPLSYFAPLDNPAEVLQGDGELSGARVARILDDVAWPDDLRVLDDGVVPLLPTTLAGNVLTELLLTADSEGGAIYGDASGRIVYRDRDWLTGQPVAGYVTVDPPIQPPLPEPAIPWVCPAATELDFSAGRVRNTITLGARTRPGIGDTETRHRWERTASTPTAGELTASETAPGVDEVRVSETNANGGSVLAALDALWVDSFVKVTSLTDADRWVLWKILEPGPVDAGDHYVIVGGRWDVGPAGEPAAGEARVDLLVRPFQVARTDVGSVAAYGPRSILRTDLLCASVDDVEFLADRLVGNLAQARPRVTGVEVLLHDPNTYPADVEWVASVDFGTRVRVGNGRWELDALVQGVEHTITATPSGPTWRVVWRTDDTFLEPVALHRGERSPVTSHPHEDPPPTPTPGRGRPGDPAPDPLPPLEV